MFCSIIHRTRRNNNLLSVKQISTSSCIFDSSCIVYNLHSITFRSWSMVNYVRNWRALVSLTDQTLSSKHRWVMLGSIRAVNTYSEYSCFTTIITHTDMRAVRQNVHVYLIAITGQHSHVFYLEARVWILRSMGVCVFGCSCSLPWSSSRGSLILVSSVAFFFPAGRRRTWLARSIKLLSCVWTWSIVLRKNLKILQNL